MRVKLIFILLVLCSGKLWSKTHNEANDQYAIISTQQPNSAIVNNNEQQHSKNFSKLLQPKKFCIAYQDTHQFSGFTHTPALKKDSFSFELLLPSVIVKCKFGTYADHLISQVKFYRIRIRSE